MAGSYSLDLRQRVVAFVEAGHSRHEAGRHFAVSESFARRVVGKARSGSLAPGKQGRPRGSGKLEPHAAFLIGAVETKPDITMPELSARLAAAQGSAAAPAELSRWLCWRGFTYKKALMATERARADVAEARRSWIGARQKRMREQPARLVFVDETAVNTKMVRLRGRSNLETR